MRSGGRSVCEDLEPAPVRFDGVHAMSFRQASSLRHAKAILAGLLVAVVAVAAADANPRQSRMRTPSVSAEPQSPVIILVSLKRQKLHVYDVNGEIATSRISSGMPGFDTPTGVFSLLEKNQFHVSNIYAGAPMPFMQRLTWSGIALHAGVVPGYRASHGCIRLPYSFARSLFGTTKLGSRVVVTGDETVPVAFDHPKLFKPLPRDVPPATVAINNEPQVASNDPVGDIANVARVIGVTPALAAAVAEHPLSEERRPATRAEADRMLTDRIVRLQSNMKAAERVRISATERAKLAVRAADEARTKLEEARRVVDPLRSQVSEAQKRQQNALRNFVAYMSAAYPSDASDTPALDNTEEQEGALEDEILDLTRAADAARESAARGEFEFAGLQAAFAAADAARSAALESVRQNQIKLRTVQADLINANKEIVRRLKPVSVFISTRTRKIIVRQGFENVIEADITVDPDATRIGTHVFTAMRFDPEDGDRFDWRLVSAHTPREGEVYDVKKKRNRREASPQSTSANVEMASIALDGITLPENVVAKVTELARPGASLIISDRDLPRNENGNGTEFVVLTR